MHDLEDVGSASGAPMGRPNHIVDAAAPVEFEIVPLRWVDGDYDEGGAYWGAEKGERIYRAVGERDDDYEEIFVRAKSLSDAKAQILETYPEATFAESADLDAFLDAYVAAALWSTRNDRADENEDEAEMLDAAGYDVSEDAMRSMREECEQFLIEHSDLIKQAIANGHSIEDCGHDFWLTRNGHGAGFWDRDLGDLGEKLFDAAKAYSEIDLYVGDDDLVHASNEYRFSSPTP